MKSKSIFVSFLFIIIAFIFLNCSSHGTTNVKIHINLGLNNASAVNTFENSIFDRIFRLFTKDVEAQTAPPNVTSIILNISGSGMETISNTYPSSTTSIDLDVPSGPSRLFEVLAHTPSATLRGAVTQSLVGGTTVTIPISMGLYETKIVIPDWYNSRLVQIDDMSGTNWRQRIRTDIGYIGGTVFRPQDVAFDLQGRIFIANDTPESAGAYLIIRINDITATSYTPIINGNATGLDAMTIDTNNSFIHYSVGTTLYRTNLGGTGSVSTNMSASIGSIRGMAVDDQGLVYIAGSTNLGLPAIFVCNPTNPTPPYHTIVRSVTNTTITYLVTPWHVLVKGNYLYIANSDGTGTNSQIIQLNTDLSSPVGFGQNVDAVNTALGMFYNPRRFLAILNRKITIIDDENQFPANLDKLVSMDDILGTNWVTYGTQGSGAGQFNFYNFC